MMGRWKLRKALPYNVSKMASNYRLRILNFLIFRILWSSHELFMADYSSVLSVTNRPFQDAKVCGKLVCSKCIENNEGVKFFFDDFGLKQHFKVKHRSLKFDDSIHIECRRRFRELHADETLQVVKQLLNLRLETVCKY